MSGLTDKLIAEVESTINRINDRRAILERDLADLVTEEEEARTLLRRLKGNDTPKAKAPAKSFADYAAAIEALTEDANDFTCHDLADLLGVNLNAATQWLRTNADKVSVKRINPDAPTGTRAIYRPMA